MRSFFVLVAHSRALLRGVGGSMWEERVIKCVRARRAPPSPSFSVLVAHLRALLLLGWV